MLISSHLKSYSRGKYYQATHSDGSLVSMEDENVSQRLNCDGISLKYFGFPTLLDCSKNSLRWTTFEIRWVWKVNSFTLHALLVIKSYSLLHLFQQR